jgi:CO/xanthine dehydrogenase Mo-binding subunit
MDKLKTVGKSVEKIDSLALATGNIKYVADIELKDAVQLSILYSTVAHAEITDIDVTQAESVKGVHKIYTHKNVKRVLHTTAGQGFPEPSPYDTALFDNVVRFVGDRVAMVVAETKELADEAVKKIKVTYKEIEPVFDSEKAMDPGSQPLHDSSKKNPVPVKYDPAKNLVSEVDLTCGDLDKGYTDADYTIDHTYTTQQASHCAMEPHAAVSYFDENGRLVIVSTTQVPFHARRIVGQILEIPVGKIRVIKPRIGGGFGGKQEVLLEPLVALASWDLKRPAKLVFSRKEVFISARTRHPFRVNLKIGYKKDGEITALALDTLMNSGAYGSHGLTVLSNAGSKVVPLFNKVENWKFLGRTVYTNTPSGGAYRGYGATQAYFALNQHIDILTRTLNLDPLEYIKKWHIKEGETSKIFELLGEGKPGVAQTIKSCKLSECIDKGAEAIGWSKKRGKKQTNGDLVKGVGFSVAMQGSGIPQIDMASASMKMNDDGSFNLFMGATDIGTGSDTILAQMAAEILQIPVSQLIVLSSDTDLTPFDVGAYACSTTYISGAAVKKCAEKIKDQILDVAAKKLGAQVSDLYLDEMMVKRLNSKDTMTFSEIAYLTLYEEDQFQIQASASHISEESPAPFIAQFVDLDVDTKTGKVHLNKYVSAVDCGQPINPILVEGQVEGAVVNSLSYALIEEYDFNDTGKMTNPGFWDYKIFNSLDIPKIETIVVDSHDETGPFGAKSVGEIGINGGLPAIANAIFDAVGVRMFDAPFTPEKVLKEINKEA